MIVVLILCGLIQFFIGTGFLGLAGVAFWCRKFYKDKDIMLVQMGGTFLLFGAAILYNLTQIRWGQ